MRARGLKFFWGFRVFKHSLSINSIIYGNFAFPPSPFSDFSLLNSPSLCSLGRIIPPFVVTMPSIRFTGVLVAVTQIQFVTWCRFWLLRSRNFGFVSPHEIRKWPFGFVFLSLCLNLGIWGCCFLDLSPLDFAFWFWFLVLCFCVGAGLFGIWVCCILFLGMVLILIFWIWWWILHFVVDF